MVPKGVNQEGKEDKMFKRLIIRGLRYFMRTVQDPAEEIRNLILEAGKCDCFFPPFLQNKYHYNT